MYGNSHGFIGSALSSRHSSAAILIASSEQGMQRDYWYAVDRVPERLASDFVNGIKRMPVTW